MFAQEPKDPKLELDEVIEELQRDMLREDGSSDEYARMMAHLTRLYTLKERERPAPRRVSPDTLAIVLGNLAGIIVIVAYEQRSVVTSKALNFVMKAAR